MKTSEKITAKQEKLIVLLLTETTIEKACQKANLAVTTYWRWMQDEKFLRQYRKARHGILENTIAKLQSISFAAIDTLERNLNCENPSVEVRSAAIILEQSLKGLELLDIESRVELIEESLRAKETENE